MRKNRFAWAIAALTLTATAAFADDTIKLAVGQRGNWDTSVSEVGQMAGIFKKHGLVLDIVYTNGAGETQQAVISGSVLYRRSASSRSFIWSRNQRSILVSS